MEFYFLLEVIANSCSNHQFQSECHDSHCWTVAKTSSNPQFVPDLRAVTTFPILKEDATIFCLPSIAIFADLVPF